jgi:histone-lysine N-methyltransferase SETD1
MDVLFSDSPELSHNLREASPTDLRCSAAVPDPELFIESPTPVRQFSKFFQNTNHRQLLLHSDRYLDESMIANSLNEFRATFQRLSYVSGFLEFTTATMAQHAAARLRRRDSHLQITFQSPLSINSLVLDRREQQQVIYDPPKCLILEGVRVDAQLTSLLARFDIVSFEVAHRSIYTYHRDAASVSDFVSAFAGDPWASVTDWREAVRGLAIAFLLERLIDAVTEDCVASLARDIDPPARRRPPRRERAPSPKPADPAPDFDAIRQPEVERGSSRLTAFSRLPEWRKREYLRPCAIARRAPYVAARKDGGRLLESQAERDTRSSPRTYWEKSAIHGFGLFALDTIFPGEHICNYTGELIRMRVADARDERAQRRGIGRTFMFRIGDSVIDATHTGSNARFLNCSCEPNCRAETVQVAGEDRVSFIATRAIRPHDEITFDFKMQLERDPGKWEFCYCRAPTCNGYLNYSVDRDELARRTRQEDLMQSDSDSDSS